MLIPPFETFEWTPTLPKIYWDVKSQEQRIKLLCLEIGKLQAYSDLHTEEFNKALARVDELDAELQKFKESGFDDYYRDQVEKWIGDNLGFVFESVAKQVWFGLTSTGYFCAYVPDSWSDVIFDTGMVYGEPTYGRLILKFDATGSGIINNTGMTSITMRCARKSTRTPAVC